MGGDGRLTFDTRRITLIPEGSYVSQKSTRRTHPAKEEGEFDKFKTLLNRLLKVPHSKIKAELDAEKKRTRKPRGRARRRHAYRDVD